MRISFDRQTFMLQQYGGISRYFTDLYLGLRGHADVNTELLFKRHQNLYLHEHKIGKLMSPILAKLYMQALAKANFSVPLADHEGIHHSTYYLGKPNKVNTKTALVSTVYDMIPELYPQYFKGNRHYNKMQWFEASDLIVSISHSSTADLLYFNPRLENRIRTIHLYSGFTPESPKCKPKALDQEEKPYVLFVGQRGTYKNGVMILRAFAASDPSQHGMKLLFAGGGAFSPTEQAIIERLGIVEHVQQLCLDDAELWHLYCHASGVLIPSMAEGFSLPVVEGLAANVPVICSDIPVHREVAGDYAELVNPLQFQDWVDIIKSLQSQKRPADKLEFAAYEEKLRYFSKERMVEEHIKAYSGLID